MMLLAALFTQTAAASPEAFNKLDVDGDGFISMQEIEEDPDLAEVFEDGDDNEDGKLDMVEFEKLEAADD
jgi:Ca2+-binding EF-hand superfamily protein